MAEVVKKPLTQGEIDKKKRAILFKPCKTKEALSKWIRLFLELEMPDCVVDPDSNSSPMDMIFETYSKALNNDDPKFSRVLYYASRDSYKCVEKGTLLLSKIRGLTPIEDIKMGEIIWSGRSWQPVTDHIHDGIKDGVTLNTTNGLSLTVSPIHKVWSWKPGKTPSWVKVVDLNSEDLVCFDTRHGYQNLDSIINEEEFETGYICGALQGDGCLTLMDDYNMACISASDPVVLDSFKKACIKYAGRLPRWSGERRRFDWMITSKEMVSSLRQLGLTCSYSFEKSIPEFAYKSRSAMIGFISGLFDTDGSFGDRTGILFPLTAEKMLREVQIVLAALGVNSAFRLGTKLYPGQNHAVHVITIPLNELPKLLKTGVRLRAKKAGCLEVANTEDAHDSIPMAQIRGLLGPCLARGGRDLKGRMLRPQICYKNIIRSKARNLAEWVEDRGLINSDLKLEALNILSNKWVAVKSVVIKKSVDFYDLTVANDHSYWSNGIISHNTLGAAVLEVLCAMHLGHDVGHLAALENQSRVCARYVKKFFNLKYLRDFKTGDNLDEVFIEKYTNKNTQETITVKEWRQLPSAQQDLFKYHKNIIKIIICTIRGVNSFHCPILICVDGNTRILEKNNRNNIRRRKQSTARGIFNRLKGRKPGGNPNKINQQPEIINNPVEHIELMSLNQTTGLWEFSKIIKAQCILDKKFKIETNNGNSLVCSSTHPLYLLGKGFKPLHEICIGDKILRIGKTTTDRTTVVGLNTVKDIDRELIRFNNLDDEIHQIILGSVLGDCGIYKKPMNNPYLQEQHCLEQEGYVRWKWGIISRLIRIREMKNPRSGYTGDKQVGFSSGNSPLLLKYNKVRTELEGINELGPLGLAVWYMDDGCNGNGFSISTENFTKEQNEILSKMLWDRFKIKAEPEEYHKEEKSYWRLRGGVDAKRKLVEYCAPYIHPEMAYKFDVTGNKTNCRICGREFWHIDRSGRASLDCGDLFCRLVVNGTFLVDTVKSINPDGEGLLYDFTLENNHNYVSNYLLSHNCDEIDVVADLRAYEDAKMIPAPMNGALPITLLTSTRKISTGLVQKEIDNAVDKDGITKLHIRHWNLIDVTEKCPPERCLPDLPKIPIYVNEDQLEAISEVKFNDQTEDEKAKFVKHEGFQGCLSNCKLFSSCKTRLYTIQKSTSKLLRPIDHTINQFKNVTLENAKAQLLCRQPSAEGKIYSSLDRNIHLKTAAQMAEILLGAPVDPNFTKKQLITLLRERDDWGFYAGMDFGFTHNFAVTTGAADGYRMFIIDAFCVPNLLPDGQVNICNKRIKYLNPVIFADPEGPMMVAVLKQAGFRMKKWIKGPGSLLGGMDVVKLKLREPMGDPTLFFLAGDPGVEELFKQLSHYHWKVNANGEMSDVPDEKDDDGPDALRYLVMNKFSASRSGSAHMSKNDDKQDNSSMNSDIWTKQNMFSKILEENGVVPGIDSDNSGNENGIKWSF